MEHTSAHRVDPERMHPDYAAQEQRFRQEAGKLWEQEQSIRASIRADVTADEEGRMERYINSHRQLQEKYEQLSEKFGQEVSKEVLEATQKLHSGGGERFGSHLIELSSRTADELPTLMKTARRTGDEDLQRAIAQAALEKNRPGIFAEWAESNPQTAAAIEKLHRTPGAEQLYDRVRALKPPKAKVEDLYPSEADRQKAAEAEAARSRKYADFFGPSNLPRQQVGRRTA